MVSPRFAELKPIVDVNTGEYSELKKNVFILTQILLINLNVKINCPNRRRSSGQLTS